MGKAVLASLWSQGHGASPWPPSLGFWPGGWRQGSDGATLEVGGLNPSLALAAQTMGFFPHQQPRGGGRGGWWAKTCPHLKPLRWETSLGSCTSETNINKRIKPRDTNKASLLGRRAGARQADGTPASQSKLLNSPAMAVSRDRCLTCLHATCPLTLHAVLVAVMGLYIALRGQGFCLRAGISGWLCGGPSWALWHV